MKTLMLLLKNKDLWRLLSKESLIELSKKLLDYNIYLPLTVDERIDAYLNLGFKIALYDIEINRIRYIYSKTNIITAPCKLRLINSQDNYSCLSMCYNDSWDIFMRLSTVPLNWSYKDVLIW